MRASERETSQYGQIFYDLSVFCGAQNSLNYIRFSYVLRFNNSHRKYSQKYLFEEKMLNKLKFDN